MVVDMGFVLVLPLHVFMWEVGVLQRRMVVLVGMSGGQMLYFRSAAPPGVVRDVHVLVAVEHLVVAVGLEVLWLLHRLRTSSSGWPRGAARVPPSRRRLVHQWRTPGG